MKLSESEVGHAGRGVHRLQRGRGGGGRETRWSVERLNL